MPAGRPAFKVTEQVIKQAETLGAQGLTLKQIAHVLGISYQTLNEKRKEFSELSEAIEIGRAKGVAKVTNALFEKAVGGDVHAAKYYLNNRDNANWKDKVETYNYNEDVTPDKKPEEMTDEELREAIEQGKNVEVMK